MKWLGNTEFHWSKLLIYGLLNLAEIVFLSLQSHTNANDQAVIFVWSVILLLFLCAGVLFLIDFIRIIPKASAKISHICLATGFILSLILLTYANIYLLIYRIYGEKAFSFSGKHLTINDFLYYSITTFTTTGFGDITSIGIVSNAASASEMIVGMITNTIMMAVLTSKLVSSFQKQ